LINYTVDVTLIYLNLEKILINKIHFIDCDKMLYKIVILNQK